MERRISKTEIIYYEEEKSFLLFEKIQNKEYHLLKVLKDSNRSHVILLEISGEKYIYKEPREKNTRKWQRVLSFFRGSESRREGLQLQEIKRNGFLAPTFCYFYEEKKWGMAINSHLVYHYIEALEPSQDKAEDILKYLQEVHRRGFLHGDSQISNFLWKDNSIYLIDSKFQKNHYGVLGKAYEVYYLELSCPEVSLNVNRGELAYKIAKFWKDMKEAWVKWKTRRREKK